MPALPSPVIRSYFERGCVAVAIFACGCAAREPLPVLPPPPEPQAKVVAAPHPDSIAWTIRPQVQIRTLAGLQMLAGPVAVLRILGEDSIGLRVWCATCPEAAIGWADTADVAFPGTLPATAASGDLISFVLALSEAAAAHDVDALRPVMADEFTFSLRSGGGRLEALGQWEREGYRTLSRLPALLEGGLETTDGRVWAAPAAFARDAGYSGLRAGFKRNAEGLWEWVFLVGGTGAD